MEIKHFNKKYDRITKLQDDRLRLENRDLLISFRDRCNKNCGWCDYVDSLIVCHLFEVYYRKATSFLDGKPVETQLIYMWRYIKNYELD